MDAFESIVARYLESEGYWVRQSVKVPILKEDKKAIGLPTMPTPEIDLVAFNVRANELLLIEAKSFLDSSGVRFEGVSGKNQKAGKRYRLFTDSKFREVVTKGIRQDYVKQGLIDKSTKINYALAAGNIHSTADESKISDYLLKKGWKLFSPKMIKSRMKELSKKGWEDDVVTMTAKLILREDR